MADVSAEFGPGTGSSFHAGVVDRIGCRQMGRLADVMETESLCHGSGKICRELTNLGLNVTEIGVTQPATHLLDDVVVVAPSEFESHGTPIA